jgi:hypothetical protein
MNTTPADLVYYEITAHKTDDRNHGIVVNGAPTQEQTARDAVDWFIWNRPDLTGWVIWEKRFTGGGEDVTAHRCIFRQFEEEA